MTPQNKKSEINVKKKKERQNKMATRGEVLRKNNKGIADSFKIRNET